MKAVTKVISLLIIAAALSAAKDRYVSTIEVLDSHVGSRTGSYVMPGNSSTNCSATAYTANCNSTGSGPINYNYQVRQVTLRAIVNGNPVIIWCEDGWRSCENLAPGKYAAEVKGDRIFVKRYSLDGKKWAEVAFKALR